MEILEFFQKKKEHLKTDLKKKQKTDFRKNKVIGFIIKNSLDMF